MKWSDSIVDEVRAAREALARDSDDDMEKIVEAARTRQAQSGREVVTLPPKRTDRVRRAS
jgi:hypothetical protein